MDSIHPLKAYRERQSPPLSQDELATLLGVSKASISRWETGERKPELELLPGIREKTGILPEQMRPDMAAVLRARPRRAPARAKRPRAA
jgi:transcriptional regulator with XRE-family HTH domain